MAGNTSRQTISQEVNNFYDRTLLSRLLPQLQYLQFAQIRDIPRNAGTNTIKFRRYNSLSAKTSPLVEGVTPQGSKLSATELTADVKQYGDYISLTDVLQYETPDPILAETYELQGEQTAETLDTLMRDVLSAGTNVEYAGGSAERTDIDSDDKISAEDIRKIVRTLSENKAKPITRRVAPDAGYETRPVDASYIGIIGPKGEYDLKQLDDFISVEQYSNKANVLEGEIGKVDKVRFILSHNTKVWEDAGSGDEDVYATLIFGQDAFGMTRVSGEAMKTITKPLGSAGTADPLEQRATAGWKATFVGKILNDDAIVRYEHAVS